MCDVFLHPVVVRSPTLIEKVQRFTGRRAIWSVSGTHAELVPEDWWQPDQPADDYTGDFEPPTAA